MDRQITLDIPDAVTSHLVIATADPPGDLGAFARDLIRRRCTSPLREVILDLLGTPLLELRTEPVADSIVCDLPELGGAGNEERLRLEKASHHLVIASHAPLLGQPEHAQASRALARVLAAACDGVIADLRSQQVLAYEARLAAEPVDFRLADEWLAAFITEDDEEAGGVYGDGGLYGWSAGPGGCSRIRVESAGLHRFGVPDLEVSTVPALAWWEAVSLIRGAAVALLGGHWDWLVGSPGEQSRRIASSLWVESADIWNYWALDAAGAPRRVQASLRRVEDECPGAPPYLQLGPPAGFAGTHDEWWEEVVRPVVPLISDVPIRAAA